MYRILAIGTDTEVFLKDKAGNNVTAIGRIGGTKANPRPLDDKGSAVQEDNVMLEFNTPPARNDTEWVNGINNVLINVIEELKQKGLVINISPSVEFASELLKNPQAQHMGCEPDFCAWTGDQNEVLTPALLGDVRTAGGHIHVSFQVDDDDPTAEQKLNLLRVLDLTLGVPSVLLDDDERRRKYYGRPGAYRIKAINRVEYRTLSNFWIRNDPLKRWVFNNTVEAVRRLNQNGRFYVENRWGEFDKNKICECIQTGNKKTAESLINTYRIPMPE